MADKLNSLIMALENTDTYDRENALIDLSAICIHSNSIIKEFNLSDVYKRQTMLLSSWRSFTA